jgi:hypothetical protein
MAPALAHATTADPALRDEAWLGEAVPDIDAEQQASFDTSWTKKLTGKYRTVFDVPEIDGAVGVWRAGLWQGHYRDVLKADAADLNAVIVIRHMGIPLLMNHEFWETYRIGKKSKVRNPAGKGTATRNPALMTVEEDQLPARYANLTLPKQMAAGAIVLGCNMAFEQLVVGTIQKEDKLSPADAKAKALSMVIPGAIMQPNGIFGVTLAQHSGCAYVMAV